jgi:hypothetical protein
MTNRVRSVWAFTVTFYFLVVSENLSVFMPNVKGKMYGEKDTEDNNPLECVSSVHVYS